MVLTPSGLVLTNNHVIDGATAIRVQIGGTGPTYTAHVVGYDVTDDIAVIQLENASGLQTITAGNPSALQVGDAVVAIGNALGLAGPHAVTTGTIAALDQTITAGGDTPGSEETLHGVIQSTATLQPGDSGGALVNRSGQVVGMNSAALASRRRVTSSRSSVGYAIPIDKALAVAQQIIDGKSSSTVHIGARAILGVEIAQAANGTDSLVISGVQTGGPAAKAGIQTGDTITAVDGTTVASLDDLQSTLGSHAPGDQVKVSWTTAAGATHTATVTLAAGPPA